MRRALSGMVVLFLVAGCGQEDEQRATPASAKGFAPGPTNVQTRPETVPAEEEGELPARPATVSPALVAAYDDLQRRMDEAEGVIAASKGDCEKLAATIEAPLRAVVAAFKARKALAAEVKDDAAATAWLSAYEKRSMKSAGDKKDHFPVAYGLVACKGNPKVVAAAAPFVEYMRAAGRQ